MKSLLVLLRSWPCGARGFARRMVAALALLALSSANAEAVEGMLRDGSVHHQPAAVAAQHAVSGGDHGHEDGPLTGHSDHGTGHQHGTGADHCTHHHGTALPPSRPPADRAGAQAAPSPEAPGRPARISTAPFHPPRA